MAIRNSKELGSNLFLIAKRLLSNQKICQLLVNSDVDPFENPVEKPLELLNKNILVVPQVNEKDFNRDSKIVLTYPSGSKNGENDDFKSLNFNVLVYTTLDTWIVNDENLRPFLLMGQIEESLKDKRINGIGTMRYYGFEISLLTDKISCYKMNFGFDVFD